jgi:Leu/Phe-tRNA-protein transferase
MSATLEADEENPTSIDIILPKLHLERSALFFKNLHVKRSIRPFLPRYELRFDTDFKTIVNKCIQTHGEVWLTPSLIQSVFSIRDQNISLLEQNQLILSPTAFPLPVSFSLYRDGKLKAGEFGVICGRVYTSYSGFKEEDNAGTVQMILMTHALEEAGFDFLDFGMPLDYKTDLGAQNISPEHFVALFRSAQLD